MAHMLSQSKRKALLALARAAIEAHFKQKDLPKHSFTKKCCCFVSLHKNDELRGCIGSFIPKLLGDTIFENAIAAATRDFRFEPVTLDELDRIKIEISVLSKPKPLKFNNARDLVRKLSEKKPGAIIEFENQCATFLPQVWEQLPAPEEFLSHLCVKAGLPADAWKNSKLNVKIYYAEVICE